MFATSNLLHFNAQSHESKSDKSAVYVTERGKFTIIDDEIENNILKKNERDISCNVNHNLFKEFLNSKLCSILDDRDDSMLRSTLSNSSNEEEMIRVNEEEHREQIDLFEEYAIKAEMLSLASFDSFDPEERHLQCSAR